MVDSTPTTRLPWLIHRTDRVLAVMHAPTAAHARLMELARAEVAFVGTSGVVGTYTGLADVGVATMTECLTIAGWIAQSVHDSRHHRWRYGPRRHYGRAPADRGGHSGRPRRYPY